MGGGLPIQIYRRIHPAIVRLCVDDLRARDDLRAPYNGLGRAKLPLGRSKQLLRKAIHFLSYHFILKRRRTTVARVAGFRLTVRPTVFHPRYFLTSKFFANFLAGLDLNGKRVADVGTGSGILALAAARAGAANVIAIDINPNAAETAAENARANGLGTRVTAVASDLLSALTPLPISMLFYLHLHRLRANLATWLTRPGTRGRITGILRHCSMRPATGSHPEATCMCCFRPIPIWNCSEISLGRQDFRSGWSLRVQSSLRHC